MSAMQKEIQDAWERVKLALKQWRNGLMFGDSVIDAIQLYIAVLQAAKMDVTHYHAFLTPNGTVAVRLCDIPQRAKQDPMLLEILAKVWGGE